MIIIPKTRKKLARNQFGSQRCELFRFTFSLTVDRFSTPIFRLGEPKGFQRGEDKSLEGTGETARAHAVAVRFRR